MPLTPAQVQWEPPGAARASFSPVSSQDAPRLVALQRALTELIAAPFARASELDSALAAFDGDWTRARLGAGGQEWDLYGSWAQLESPQDSLTRSPSRKTASKALKTHIDGMQRLLDFVRSFVAKSGQRILVSAAQKMEPPSPPLDNADLRRMVFIRQYETVAAVEAAQQRRLAPGGLVHLQIHSKPRLGQVNAQLDSNVLGLCELGNELWVCRVLRGAELLCGWDNDHADFFAVTDKTAEEISAARRQPYFSLHKCLLTADDLVSEQHAADLLHLKMLAHPESHKKQVAFGSVVRFPFDCPGAPPGEYALISHESRDPLVKSLHIGAQVHLSGRVYEGNMENVVDFLRNVDKGVAKCPILQLLQDPVAFARGPPEPALPSAYPGNCLGGAAAAAAAEPLGLERSQEAAFQAVISTRAAVVWGPPGTGKTHFLAVTILRLMRAAVGAGQQLHILFTSMSKAAMDELSERIDKLAVGDFPWLAEILRPDDGKLVHRFETQEPSPAAGDIFSKPQIVSVSAGTLWAIKKRCLDSPKGALPYSSPACTRGFDVVMIDEASQMLTPDSALALGVLSEHGRLIVAGDDEQLSPILNLQWPSSGRHIPVHLSILECLRECIKKNPPRNDMPQVQHQLLECRRLNEQLVELSRTIYGRQLTAKNPHLALARVPNAKLPWVPPSHPLHAALSALLECNGSQRPNALLRIRLPSLASPGPTSTDALLDTEAQAAAEIVIGLLMTAHAVDAPGAAAPRALLPRDFFIVAPHRRQRAKVRDLLKDVGLRAGLPLEAVAELQARVDTTEKIQGQECQVVVCCWGSLDHDAVASETDFVLSRRRLNVAVTRARRAAVLLLCDAIETPALTSGALLTRERQSGAQYLLDFGKRASRVEWSSAIAADAASEMD